MIGEKIVWKLISMSITGSAVILLILLIRPLLKRIPKKYLCALWLIPFARLLMPVSISAPFSLLPVNPDPIAEMMVEGGTVPALDTGIEVIDIPVNLVLADTLSPRLGDSADPVQVYTFILFVIWSIGMTIFLGINFFRYWKLKRESADAVPGEQGVYYSDRISMPMILGLFKPRIYLPSMFLREEYEEEKRFVLEHELAHKKRFDHLIKPLVFFALAVYWFNPFVWAAYSMLCRDMEMACDELVMEKMGAEAKKDYSLTLLHFEERRSALLLPLAFGESHTKSRIKNILNYKKPGFWVNLAAIFLLIFAARTLLTNPQTKKVASSVAVIGGADGPTSIFLAGKLGEDTDRAEAENIDIETVKKQPYGTDVELDYVSAEKIAMHGSFGYLIFRFRQDGNLNSDPELYRAVTLSEAGPIYMQGDPYTEIIGGDGAAMILTNAYSGEKEQKSVYFYYEEDNTIEKLDDLKESDLQNFVNSILGDQNGKEYGHPTDARVEDQYMSELEEAVRRQYGEENGILYGPAVVPEMNSNVYGFLAADGGNVENIWYGLWWKDDGRIVRAGLFDKSLK